VTLEDIERLLKELYNDTLKEPVDKFRELLAKLK
jgi:hypothetical protein